MQVIIEYKALLNKDDLVKLFGMDEMSEGGQRNKASKIMKSVKEQYKKDNGIDWKDTFIYKNVSQNVIPTETFLKCCPEFRKSFRRQIMQDIRMNSIQDEEMELSIYPFNPKRIHLSKEEKELLREKRYQKRITIGINIMLFATIVILLVSIACLGKSYAMLFL